jgi:hypothetical protein
VNSLPDAERDASDVVQALAALAALLHRPGVELDDETRALVRLAEGGAAAAGRVLAYLRVLRGAGDGQAAAVPPRLGPWRDWVPPRGHLLGDRGPTVRRTDGIPHQPRRGDPGE